MSNWSWILLVAAAFAANSKLKVQNSKFKVQSSKLGNFLKINDCVTRETFRLGALR
jgi:hypothetical protein